MSEQQNSDSALVKMLQHFEFMKKISGFLAAPISVFLHRRIGFRELSPRWTAGVAFAMCLIATLFPDFAGPSPACVYVYAIVMLALCCYQRWVRWNEFVNEMKWHTRSIGRSFLDGLPLPRVLQPFMRPERFVEPFLAAIVGVITAWCLSRFLGLLIVLCAVFLHVYHDEVFKKQLSQLMDDADNMIESEHRANLVKGYANSAYADEHENRIDGSGLPLPSGVDFILRQRLNRRRAEVEELTPR